MYKEEKLIGHVIPLLTQILLVQVLLNKPIVWVRSEYYRWLPSAELFTNGMTMVPMFANKLSCW